MTLKEPHKPSACCRLHATCKALIYCGMLFFAISLVIPSVSHGEHSSWGIQCFWYSAIAPLGLNLEEFRDLSGYMIAAQWGRIANVAALLILLLDRKSVSYIVIVIFNLFFSVSVTMLIYAPMSDFHAFGSVVYVESFSSGYFLWVCSLLMMVGGKNIAQFCECQVTGRQVK